MRDIGEPLFYAAELLISSFLLLVSISKPNLSLDGCGGSSVQCKWSVHYFKVLYLHCHCSWLLQKSPSYALVLLFQYPAVLSVDPMTLAVPVQVLCCKRTKSSNNAICTYISQRESIGVIHWVSGGNKVKLGLGGYLAQYVTIRSKYSPDPIFKLVDLA